MTCARDDAACRRSRRARRRERPLAPGSIALSLAVHTAAIAALMVVAPRVVYDALPRPLVRRGEVAVQIRLVDSPPDWAQPARVAPEPDAPIDPTRPQEADVGRRSPPRIPPGEPTFRAELLPAWDHPWPASELEPVRVTTAPPAPEVVASTPVRPLLHVEIEPLGAAGADQGVTVLCAPAPEYPEACRRRQQQGVVVLEVEVLADGAVGRIRVIRPAPYERLTEAAVEALRRAKFAPAVRDGWPVAAVVTIPFRFRLIDP